MTLVRVAALILALFSVTCLAVSAQSNVDVTTVAGDGSAGLRDGTRSDAQFLLPTGIVRAPDGRLFVSDQAAQRIREIQPNGTVSTLAGSGALESEGFSVAGGFADGPGSRARFNRPTGLALASNGDLYIADSFNACIRKLSHGIVSTVAGHAGDSKAVDGKISEARFVHPQSLAFDRRGILYVADDGGGLRRVDLSAGEVTTIVLTTKPLDKAMMSITISPGPGAIMLIATRSFLFTYNLQTLKDELYNFAEIAEGNRPFGNPNALASLHGNMFLFSDSAAGNIRFTRLPVKPYTTRIFTRVIAGGGAEHWNDNADYRDGSRSTARFNIPLGIVINGNTAYVADAGNRRIRKLTLPSFRESEAGPSESNHVDDEHFEVALVGASWVFWDTTGDDSMCASIEKTLNGSHRFHKPVRCHSIRIDSANVAEMGDYIKNFLPYERMDAVIMDLGPWMPEALLPSGSSRDALAVRLESEMRSILNVLTPTKTSLSIAWTYSSYDVSPTEDYLEHQGDPYFPFPNSELHREAQQFGKALSTLPITQYDAYDDLVRYERSPSPVPLYGTRDSHFSPHGNQFFGEHIAQGLLRTGLTENKR